MKRKGVSGKPHIKVDKKSGRPQIIYGIKKKIDSSTTPNIRKLTNLVMLLSGTTFRKDSFLLNFILRSPEDIKEDLIAVEADFFQKESEEIRNGYDMVYKEIDPMERTLKAYYDKIIYPIKKEAVRNMGKTKQTLQDGTLTCELCGTKVQIIATNPPETVACPNKKEFYDGHSEWILKTKLKD